MSHKLPRGLRCPGCQTVISFTLPAPGQTGEGPFAGRVAECTRCHAMLITTPGPGLRLATHRERENFVFHEFARRAKAAFVRRGEQLDVSIPTLLAAVGWPTTPANVAWAEKILRAHVATHCPGAEVRIVDRPGPA